jgi:hypothetical protein
MKKNEKGEVSRQREPPQYSYRVATNPVRSWHLQQPSGYQRVPPHHIFIHPATGTRTQGFRLYVAAHNLSPRELLHTRYGIINLYKPFHMKMKFSSKIFNIILKIITTNIYYQYENYYQDDRSTI